jgi:intracellular septation protein A
MLGVPGILVIILLFISMLVFFYRGIEKDVLLSSVALVLIIGLLAKNMTDDFFIKDVSLTFWMLLGILSGVIATKRDDLSSNV